MLPTSLFVLPAGSFTPKRWDCKGVLIPKNRSVAQGANIIHGPVALKYRDLRRVIVTETDGRYQCPHSNGVIKPTIDQIDLAIPLSDYDELLIFPRRTVTV